MRHRDRQLVADIGDPDPARPAAGPPSPTERLAAGVRSLSVRRRSGSLGRSLMLIGGGLVPVGILVVLLGWYGASHTPNVYEQVPYVISGGLLGVSLVFAGGFFYFTHWQAQLLQDHRTQSAALLDEHRGNAAALIKAIGHLELALRATGSNGTQTDSGRTRLSSTADTGLVATSKGTMSHLPECVVVAGKRGLRPVADGSGFAPCRLCQPDLAAV